MRIVHYGLSPLAILGLVLFCFSCESYRGDLLPDESRIEFRSAGTEYYTLPESSILIELKSRVTFSYVTFYVELLDQPPNGHVSIINGSFLKYTPDPGFRVGEDAFRIGFYAQTGELLAIQKLTIHMSGTPDVQSCGLQAIGDFIKTTTATAGTVRVVRNDLICNPDFSASLLVPPAHGKAVLTGDSIRYVPNDGYTGPDRLIYQLQSKLDPEASSYGYVDIQVASCDLTAERFHVDLMSVGMSCFDSNGVCLPEINDRIACLRAVAAGTVVTTAVYASPLYGLVKIGPTGEVYYQPLLMPVGTVKNDSFQLHLKYRYAGEGESERFLRLVVNVNRVPPPMSCVYNLPDVILDLTDGQARSTVSLAGCSLPGYLMPSQPAGPQCAGMDLSYRFVPLGESRRSGTFCWDDTQIVYSPDGGKLPANDTLRMEVQMTPLSLVNVQRYIVKRN
jgi:hypothetical protein